MTREETYRSALVTLTHSLVERGMFEDVRNFDYKTTQIIMCSRLSAKKQ